MDYHKIERFVYGKVTAYSYLSTMTKHNNKQLKVHHLHNYLGQINSNTSPDTKIKFLCRAANCFMKTGGLQNVNKAINLYTQAYDIQSDVRGSSHARSLNILNSIVKCENFVTILKNNKKRSSD